RARGKRGDGVAAGPEICTAFHRFLTGSKGTKDCAWQAIEAGIPAYLIDSEKAERRRLREDDRRVRWGPGDAPPRRPARAGREAITRSMIAQVVLLVIDRAQSPSVLVVRLRGADQLLIEPLTVLKVPLTLVPSDVTIVIQATRMSASMTAYSTAVGPSSLL